MVSLPTDRQQHTHRLGADQASATKWREREREEEAKGGSSLVSKTQSRRLTFDPPATALLLAPRLSLSTPITDENKISKKNGH